MNSGKLLRGLRHLTIVIVLFGFVSALFVNNTAFADSNPVITLTQSGEMAVEVNISNNVGLYAANFTLSYDERLLTYSGYERGSALADMELVATGNEVDSENICFNFLSNGAFNDFSNGTVLTLYFTPKQDALGNANVTLTYNRGNDVLRLSNGVAVAQNVLIDGATIMVNAGSSELLFPVMVAVIAICLLAITLLFVLHRRARALAGDNNV